MLRTILTFILGAVALMSPVTVGAEDTAKNPGHLREDLARAQAYHIAAELKLDHEKASLFAKTYCEAQEAVWKLGATPAPAADTDEEIDKAIRARFDKSQRILEVRRHYYDEYRKFLTPRQIEKVYKLEKRTFRSVSSWKRTPARRIKKANKE